MIKIVIDRNKLTANGIKLTKTEMRVLEVLSQNKPNYLDSYSISKLLVGHENVTPRLGDVYFVRLRKKFGNSVVDNNKCNGYTLGNDYDVEFKDEKPIAVKYVNWILNSENLFPVNSELNEKLYSMWIGLGCP